MRSFNSSGRRGFTFFEVIVTLTLILLIVALLLPVYARSRETARGTTCLSNLQQMGTALHLYAQDHNGRFPPGGPGWAAAEMPYVKNYAIFTCPSEPLARRKAVPPGPQGQIYTSYQYRGGLGNDDAADIPLGRDWDVWHLGGVNVLYLDGHTTWEEAGKAPSLALAPPSFGDTMGRLSGTAPR